MQDLVHLQLHNILNKKFSLEIIAKKILAGQNCRLAGLKYDSAIKSFNVEYCFVK